MIVGPPKLPAACDSCGHRMPFEQIPQPCYQVLLEAHYHRQFAAELQMLDKVAEFYRRNPQWEGTVKPHSMRVVHSNDPAVRKKLFENVPLNEIELPPADEPGIAEPHPDDQEVIEYLRHHYFRLDRRLPAVREQVEDTKHAVGRVKCPRCSTGSMQLLKSDEARHAGL